MRQSRVIIAIVAALLVVLTFGVLALPGDPTPSDDIRTFAQLGTTTACDTPWEITEQSPSRIVLECFPFTPTPDPTSTATAEPTATPTAEPTATVTPPADPVTLDLPIAASDHDADEDGNGVVRTTATSSIAPTDSPDELMGFFWPDLGIPQGSVIVEAWLTLNLPSSAADEPLHSISGEAAVDAQPFVAVAENLSSRPETDAVVTWDVPDLLAPVTTQTPNLVTIAQELVDQPGWTPASGMTILIRGGLDPTRDLTVRMFDHGSGTPSLHLVYVPGPAGPAPTATPEPTATATATEPGVPTATATDEPTATATPTLPASGSLRLVPLFETISVYAPTGAGTTLEWRVAGSTDWRQGHPLSVDQDGSEARGSLVGLVPNTVYDVRVGSLTASIATRSESIPAGSGSTITVTNEAELQAALDTVNAGQTVALAAGTYVGPFTLSRDGTAQEPITITETGGDAILTNNNATSDLLTLVGADHVRIVGLTFEDSGRTLLFASDSDHLLVEGNTFTEWAAGIVDNHDNIEGAVYLRDGSHSAVIRANTMHRETPMTTKLSLSAVVTWRAGATTAIYDNTMTGGIEDGVRYGPEDDPLQSQSIDVDVYRNVISDCYDDGISPEGATINVRVWENEISDCYAGIAIAPVIEGPFYAFRNVIYDHGHHSRGGSAMFKIGDEDPGRRGDKFLYHNTMLSDLEKAGPLVTGFKQSNSGIGRVVSRNNIVVATRYAVSLGCDTTCDMDYDSLWTSDTTRFVEFRGVKYGSPEAWCNGAEQQGCHSVEHDARDDLAPDWTLLPHSDLIDAGEILPGFNAADSPWPFVGLAPDMGATEQ